MRQSVREAAARPAPVRQPDDRRVVNVALRQRVFVPKRSTRSVRSGSVDGVPLLLPRSFVRVRIARGRSSLIKLPVQHTHKRSRCTTGVCATKLTPKRELAELTSQSVQAGFFQPSCLRISMSCGRAMALTSHPFSLQYFSENAARFCISKSWSSLAPKMLCSRSPSLITDIFSSWLYLLSFPRGARLLHFYERSTLIDSVELCFAAIYRDAAA